MNMTTSMRIALLCLVCIGLPHIVLADGDNDNIRIHLSAFSEQEVDNDLMQVTLQVQRSGEDTVRLAREVREIMDQALSTARDHPTVRARTPAYTTQPVYERRDGETRQTGWRIIQTLELESTDLEATTQLVGRLQTLELRVTGLGFSVSREAREAVRRTLTAEALERWREKAAAAAGNLGAGQWRPTEIHIQDELDGPVRPLMARTMDAAMESAPAVEAGTSRIRVQINGIALGLDARANPLP